MVVEPTPDPGEVGDADVRQDERRLRIPLAERQRVAAEGGDPEPGVDDHGQSPLRGDRQHRRHTRMPQIEPLRPRMQLHSPGTGGQTALELTDRVRARVDPAERDEPTLGRFRGGEQGVVRLPVTGPLHQREHRCPSSDQGERVGELVRAAAPPVRIVAAEVSMGIEQPHSRQLLDEAAKPGQQELIRVHARTLTTVEAPRHETGRVAR